MEDQVLDQESVDLYYEYLHAPLRRRIFLLRLARHKGGEEEALATARRLDAALSRGTLAPSEQVQHRFGVVSEEKIYRTAESVAAGPSCGSQWIKQ